MARKAKDNPTNLSESDVANSLRLASSQLVEAQDALEAAREPVRGAKAVVKAAGIDFDIFKLCHGIRHLDDDDARQKRIRKLQIAIAALLSDKVQLDLFGFMVAQVKPAVKEALQQASDTLQREAPEESSEPQDQEIPFDVEPPSVPEPEPVAEDMPALAAAEDMPEGAGYAFNNGVQAGRLGHDADSNPHAEGTPERQLWEAGRAKGAAMKPDDVDQNGHLANAEAAPPSGAVVEFTGTTEQKRIQAYFFGFDNASNRSLPELTKGRRGEMKSRIEAGFMDHSEGKEPRYPRPTAVEHQDHQPQTDEAVDPVGSEPAEEGGEPEVEAEVRVEVREVDGKHKLVDVLSGSPLMDVSGPKSGQTWADQINAFFADRLKTVARDELIDAGKTLARGRLLTAPVPPPSYDLRSAV